MPELVCTVLASAICLLILVCPLAHLDRNSHPFLTLLLSRLATRTLFAVALAALFTAALSEPRTFELVVVEGLPLLAFRLDLLATSMLTMIAFVGLIVTEFSRRYLEGDSRHAAFLGYLCLTLAMTCLLVSAGTLVQLWLAWVATSLALHQLLVFYPKRRLAQLAARKKFLIARAGDLFLLVAFYQLAQAFGTVDIAELMEQIAAGANSAEVQGLSTAAWLIVLAATLKSAQLPLHGWLTEVMETPTPVSALLHAGIVNGGGFLVLRMADLLQLFPASLHYLALIGAVTAIVGSVVMLTQSSIKEYLAWSTISQMGFMFLQCGLGVFPLAWLHILTHSLYKAHGFLSAGSVVELAKDAWLPDLRLRPRLAHLFVGMATAVGLYLTAGWSLGQFPREHLAVLALGITTVLGLTALLLHAPTSARFPVLGLRTLATAALAGFCGFGLQAFAFWAMRDELPVRLELGSVDYGVLGLLLLGFPAVAIGQYFLAAWYRTDTGRALRVHLSNGLYLNAVLNRLLGALRRTQA